MEWQDWAGGIAQKEKVKKKRHSVAVWGILLQQLLQPPPHPAPTVVWKALSLYPRKRERRYHGRTGAHTCSPEESVHPNLWDQRLLRN